MSPSEVEIVIASYQENVWYIPRLEEFGFRVTLYNANEGNIRGFDICPVTRKTINHRKIKSIPVENICREASQWLHHIIERRGEFAPYTLFVQADLSASYGLGNQIGVSASGVHLKKVFEMALWCEMLPEGISFLPYPDPAPWFLYLSQHEREQFKGLFPSGVPTMTMRQPAGGQFIASSQFLDRIPLDHLSRLMNACKADPGFARWAEYVWPTLLDSCFDVFPKPESK